LLMKHGNCFRCVNGKHVAKDCKEVIKCGTCNSSQHCTIMHDTSFVKATIRLAAEPQPFMVLFIYLFFFADHRATVFTVSKTFETAQKKNLVPLFANFCHEIGCENDQTYIFRFLRYLSTFFYTYLPINIHFQFIIITNVSFVTNPAYFVRHLASPVVLF
jgi:hypothetical protein